WSGDLPALISAHQLMSPGAAFGSAFGLISAHQERPWPGAPQDGVYPWDFVGPLPEGTTYAPAPQPETGKCAKCHEEPSTPSQPTKITIKVGEPGGQGFLPEVDTGRLPGLLNDPNPLASGGA